jgi:preprotein translocase subunit YajC
MGLAYPLKFRADAFQDAGQSQDTSIRGRGAPQGDGTTAPPPVNDPAGTEQAPRGTTPAPSPCGTEQILMGVGMVAIFYFLLIRPSQKQEKARRALIASVKKGDRVVTSSGMHGVVAGIADDTIQLRVDGEGKLKLTFDRSAIARVVSGDAKPDELAKP